MDQSIGAKSREDGLAESGAVPQLVPALGRSYPWYHPVCIDVLVYIVSRDHVREQTVAAN